jgi:hypothetical protein
MAGSGNVGAHRPLLRHLFTVLIFTLDLLVTVVGSLGNGLGVLLLLHSQHGKESPNVN